MSMVMSFFGSPKGRKKATVVIGDDESLDSVCLNDNGLKGEKGNSPNNSDHESSSSYQYPDKLDGSLLHESFNQSHGGMNGIDAKLLREERQLQKILAKSKDKPLDKKVQKVTEKRREAILKEKVKAVTEMERDVIIRCLGVDEDGYCLRHQDQKVRMGIVQPSFRFETICLCKSCAFGSESGIEMKNHGQKDNTIAHAVNGALVATGVKKKKKKVKGSFAADMNGGGASPDKLRVDLNDSFNASSRSNGNDFNASFTANDNEFPSSNALQGYGSGMNNHTSPHSRSDLEQDSRWMQEVQVRVMQVNSWDNSTAPLKCHPNYAKYFRMLESGIPREEIQEMIGEHGPDLLVLTLDPEKSLNDQMPGLPSHIQQRLQSNPALITSNSVNDDETRIADLIYKSYLTQLHVFEHFLKKDEAGINALRESNAMNESSSEFVPPATSTPDGSPMKKKKHLRLTKKFKRLVGATGVHREQATDDEASEDDLLEPSNHVDENPTIAHYAAGPGPLQPLPTAGLRRARRPTAANRRPRKTAATKTPDRGVVVAPKGAETQMSPLSTTASPGRPVRASYDSNKLNGILSTSSAEEILEAAESSTAAPDVIPSPAEQPKAPVVVQSLSSAPSDEDIGGLPIRKTALPTPVTNDKEEEEKSSPAPPLVIKSFPSATKEPPLDANKEETEKAEDAAPPVVVLKSFPFTYANEEKGETGVPMVIKSFPPSKKDDEKESAVPMVIKSFPSGKRASNTYNKNEDDKAIDPTNGNGKHDENKQDTEEEKRKKEELRKAVAAMHHFKLGSYDDSFGSIPTTVLPDLHPTTGEPSIHSHLSSISSHSSDASSSYESESDSEDSDDEDDEEEEDEEDEKIEASDKESQKSEKETIDMDEYIHLSDKLIDANAELFEAKYLLENSQKREDALLEANRAKDRQIMKLGQTIEEMQSYINVLSAQNAEAGKIMMELTASIEENKRQKLFRRISIASSTGISQSSFTSSLLGEDTPDSEHKRSSVGPPRQKSVDTAGSEQRRGYGSGPHRRTSSSGHRRLSGSLRYSTNGLRGFLGPAAEVMEEGLGENSTPMMIAIENSPAAPPSNVVKAAINVSQVPPSAASNVHESAPKVPSNVRQVPHKSSASAEKESSALEDHMIPPAANVREISPHNRRRVKEVSVEEGRKQIPAAPVVPAAASAVAPAPSQPAVIRSYQPSERLAERRRKKRELEERLKMSVQNAHSSDADDSRFVSTE